MKTYSIGRDLNCDIVINDSSDVISRRHALLNVTPSGKMTIIDQSSNGTYVNGIRITPNVPVPVTRKDIVSLAHVAKLDWNQVPKANQLSKYIIIGVIAAAVIAGAVFGFRHFNPSSDPDTQPVVTTDSLNVKRDVEKVDSVKQAVANDSIKNKAREDSVKAVNKDRKGNKKSSDKSKDNEEKPQESKEKPTKSKRTFG